MLELIREIMPDEDGKNYQNKKLWKWF
jgi:hypothetical protein